MFQPLLGKEAAPTATLVDISYRRKCCSYVTQSGILVQIYFMSPDEQNGRDDGLVKLQDAVIEYPL